MGNEAKHAFGNSENLTDAINRGSIDKFDILLLDGDTDPKIGWVDEKGEVKIVKNTSIDTEDVEVVVDSKIDERLAESVVSNEDIEKLFE